MILASVLYFLSNDELISALATIGYIFSCNFTKFVIRYITALAFVKQIVAFVLIILATVLLIGPSVLLIAHVSYCYIS